MNKNKILPIFLACTLLAACAANSHKAEAPIDACKLTKPPKDAYITGAGHLGRSFTYPDPKKIPSDYTGCVKGWIGDHDSPPQAFLVASIKYKNGLVSYIESSDPDGLVVTCEYDKNESLLKETLIKQHHEGCAKLLPTAHEFVNRKGLPK